MPRKRTPAEDREFEAAVRDFEEAQRLVAIGDKIGGVEQLPVRSRERLATVLHLPLAPKARPPLRLVVDNARNKSE